MLEEAHQQFTSLLNNTILREIVDQLPNEWLEWNDVDLTPDEIRSVYYQFLITRLAHADQFLKQAQDARKTFV